jgi:hypothetical protein
MPPYLPAVILILVVELSLVARAGGRIYRRGLHCRRLAKHVQDIRINIIEDKEIRKAFYTALILIVLLSPILGNQEKPQYEKRVHWQIPSYMYENLKDMLNEFNQRN